MLVDMHRPCVVASLALVLAVPARAQGRAEEPERDPAIVLTVTTLLDGRDVEVEDPETKQKQRRTVDRRMKWEVDGAEFATVRAARDRIERLAAAPESMRPDLQGGKRLAPLRIAPDGSVRWGELLQAFDVVTGAGFAEFLMPGIEHAMIEPHAVAADSVDASKVALAGCVYCMPDDYPPDERPVIDVRRDGRILIDGAQLFARQVGQPDDLEALRKRLGELRADLDAAGLVEQRGGRERARIDVPVLLRIDRDAAWRDVSRMLREIARPEVGFWKLQPAVLEVSSRTR